MLLIGPCTAHGIGLFWDSSGTEKLCEVCVLHRAPTSSLPEQSSVSSIRGRDDAGIGATVPSTGCIDVFF